MKMTYFERPDHSYHRVLFEFTAQERKAAGFEKLSLIPSRLEILQVLNRLIEINANQSESTESLKGFCKFPLGIPYNQGTDNIETSEKENNGK